MFTSLTLLLKTNIKSIATTICGHPVTSVVNFRNANLLAVRLLPAATLIILLLYPLIIKSWDDDNGNWSSWDNDDTITISGYMESTGLVVIPRNSADIDPKIGLQNLLRLRSVFEPSSNLSVTVETEYLDRRGAANPQIRSEIIGLPEKENTLPASNQFSFDYVYGSLSWKNLDLRVGRQPLAWGTAYAFNPTDLINASSLGDLAGIEPSGIVAIAPNLTLGSSWGVEAYLGFEDQDRLTEHTQTIKKTEHFPLGIRLRSFMDAWDWSIGYARSSQTGHHKDGSGFLTKDYFTAEVVGPALGFTVYGETAVQLNNNDSNGIDAALGFQNQIFGNLGIQLEYHRKATGEVIKKDYDPYLRLQGELVARDYLVAVADFFILNDDMHIVAASLVNINDGSLALVPEATYTLFQDFELVLGASWFMGGNETEFDGRFKLPPEKKYSESRGVDIGRPQIFISSTWHF